MALRLDVVRVVLVLFAVEMLARTCARGTSSSSSSSSSAVIGADASTSPFQYFLLLDKNGVARIRNCLAFHFLSVYLLDLVQSNKLFRSIPNRIVSKPSHQYCRTHFDSHERTTKGGINRSGNYIATQTYTLNQSGHLGISPAC